MSRVITDKKTANTDPAKRLGLGYFIAAAIFLFNPCINVVDILPDFFGYLFLLKGLEKLADLCPAMEDAREGISKLRWFMLVKIFAMLMVALVDDTYVLVFTFAFAIIEAIYTLPAIGRLFDGLEYFATRFEGRSIYKNYKNVSTITYILFIARPILTVLPELCSLSDYEYDGYVTAGVQIDMARYKPWLVVFQVIMVGIIGAIWLSYILPYIKGIANEKPFLSRIVERYDIEIGTNTGLLFSRKLHTSLLLVTCGGIFLLNFWLDGMNFIPSFIMGFFIVGAMKKLAASNPLAGKVVPRAWIFTTVSFVSFAVQTLFSGFFRLTDVMYYYEAYTLYNVTRITTLLEFTALAFMMLGVFSVIRSLIKEHLGPTDIPDNRLVVIYNNHQRELEARFMVSFVLFALAFVLNAVNLLFRAEIASVLTEFWMIPFIVTGIWLIYHKSVCDTLDDQIAYKYL